MASLSSATADLKLFEDHSFVAIQQHAVFAVPLHGTRKHLAFGVAALGG
jgi:hypothetical protein